MRPSGRAPDALRDVSFTPGFARHAEGSCLIRMGGTEVLCAASVEGRVPPFLRGKGEGWVTAEYGMLPRATHTPRRARGGPRQAVRPHAGDPAPDRPLAARRGGPQGAGRDDDHARLRRAERRWRHALRRDHRRLGGAEPGAAQAGGNRVLARSPLTGQVAAVSCGLVAGAAVLDLDYAEDSGGRRRRQLRADRGGGIVEIQGTAERPPFTRRAVRRADAAGPARHRPAVRAAARGAGADAAPAAARRHAGAGHATTRASCARSRRCWRRSASTRCPPASWACRSRRRRAGLRRQRPAEGGRGGDGDRAAGAGRRFAASAWRRWAARRACCRRAGPGRARISRAAMARVHARWRTRGRARLVRLRAVPGLARTGETATFLGRVDGQRAGRRAARSGSATIRCSSRTGDSAPTAR